MGRRTSGVWMLVLAGAIAIGGCGGGVQAAREVAIVGAEAWLEAVSSLPHRSGSSKCSVALGGCVKDEGEFDPNDYFLVFDHLSLEPGYTLDSVFLSDSLGSRPVVYARRVDAQPFRSYYQFARARGDKPQPSFETVTGSDAYLEHVRVDGTPEGYLQYVLLSIVEDQYQLDWHGGYNDTTFVTSETQAVALVTRAESMHNFNPDNPLADRLEKITHKLAKLDYTPYVLMSDGEVEVRLIGFTKWGGFSEVRYTLAAAFPHSVLNLRQKSRVFYDVGILY
jgi:hypothetical protein